MAYNHFPRKEYGRIFVQKKEDIEKVEEVIRQMDSFEYEYLPDEFVGVFEVKEINGYRFIKLKETHKFDSLDLNVFQSICWHEGIPVFCPMSNEDSIRIDTWEEENGDS